MSRVEPLRQCPKENCAHLGHAGEWEALRDGGAGEGGHAHQEVRPDHPEGVPEVDQGRVLEGLLGRLSSGFKSKAGCWCGSHPSDLQARPAVGVSKGAPGAQLSAGYPLDLEARPVVGAAAILRI